MLMLKRYWLKAWWQTGWPLTGVVVVLLVLLQWLDVLTNPGDLLWLSGPQWVGLVMLKCMALLNGCLPLLTGMSLIWMLERMRMQHEWLGLTTCGVSRFTLLRWSMPGLMTLVLLSAWGVHGLQPWAEHRVQVMLSHQVRHLQAKSLPVGQFFRLGPPGWMAYVQSRHGQALQRVIWLRQASEGQVDVMTAQRMELQALSHGIRITLEGGQRLKGQLGHSDFQRLEFERMTTLWQPPVLQPLQSAHSTWELMQRRHDYPQDRAEWYWRWMLPWSHILVAIWVLWGWPKPSRRAGGMSGWLMGGVLAYMILLLEARLFVAHGGSPVALWGVEGAMGWGAAVLAWWRRR